MPTIWKKEELEWHGVRDGVATARLHRHAEGGGAAWFRMAAGAVLPLHDHVSGEHTFVIEGVVEFGHKRLNAGDAMWVEPGESHAVRAVTDALFVAVSPPKGMVS